MDAGQDEMEGNMEEEIWRLLNAHRRLTSVMEDRRMHSVKSNAIQT